MHRNRPIGSRTNPFTYSRREAHSSLVIAMLITLILSLNFAPNVVYHYVNTLVNKPNQSLVNKLKFDEHANLQFVDSVNHIQLANPEITNTDDGHFIVRGTLNGSMFQAQTNEQPIITDGYANLYRDSSSGNYYVNADTARHIIKQTTQKAIHSVKKSVTITRVSLSISLILLICVISLSSMFVIYIAIRSLLLVHKVTRITKTRIINPF